VALTWLIERRRFGWGRAICGAGLLAGLVSAPLGGLAFVAGLGAVRWAELRKARALPEPVPAP
jgi:hypothetical protein